MSSAHRSIVAFPSCSTGRPPDGRRVAARVYGAHVVALQGFRPGPGQVLTAPGPLGVVLTGFNVPATVESRQLPWDTMPTVNTNDLVDTSQVAEILELSSRTAVSVYQARYPDFPAPVIQRGRCL